jgi:hypothetical protein
MSSPDKKNEEENKLLKLYHITPLRNLSSIIQDGLEKRNAKGICTVITLEPIVLTHILETMLVEEGEEEYAVLEIDLSKHNISLDDIIPDEVEEATNELHRYILRDKIVISRDDHIKTLTCLPFGLPDFKQAELEVKEYIKTLNSAAQK